MGIIYFVIAILVVVVACVVVSKLLHKKINSDSFDAALEQSEQNTLTVDSAPQVSEVTAEVPDTSFVKLDCEVQCDTANTETALPEFVADTNAEITIDTAATEQVDYSKLVAVSDPSMTVSIVEPAKTKKPRAKRKPAEVTKVTYKKPVSETKSTKKASTKTGKKAAGKVVKVVKVVTVVEKPKAKRGRKPKSA